MFAEGSGFLLWIGTSCEIRTFCELGRCREVLVSGRCSRSPLLLLTDRGGSRRPRGRGRRCACRSSMLRDQIKVLVLTRSELLSLAIPQDLVTLLKQKFLDLTLKKTVLIPPK